MTTQISEAICYLGHYYQLTGEPLETLFDEEFHGDEERRAETIFRLPSVFEFAEYPYENKLQRPDFSGSILDSSCWRGYVGEWVIENNQLFLKELHGLSGEPLRSQVFPDRQGLVNAEWFSGILALKRESHRPDTWKEYRPWKNREGVVLSDWVLAAEEIRLVVIKGTVLEKDMSTGRDSLQALHEKYNSPLTEARPQEGDA